MTLGFPSAAPGQKVGLFGGSFDPAHAGHVQLTAQAMRRFDLDRVWWLVSPGNPLKQRGPAPLESRIEGARAILSDPRVTVSGIEATLGTRRTADTVAALQAIYPQVRFVWLMGSDNLVQFHHWDRWRAIAARVPIGVIARPGSKLAAPGSVAARALARFRLPQRDARMLATRQPPAWVMVEVPFNDASSSAIRAMEHRPAGCEPATSR